MGPICVNSRRGAAGSTSVFVSMQELMQPDCLNLSLLILVLSKKIRGSLQLRLFRGLFFSTNIPKHLPKQAFVHKGTYLLLKELGC